MLNGEKKQFFFLNTNIVIGTKTKLTNIIICSYIQQQKISKKPDFPVRKKKLEIYTINLILCILHFLLRYFNIINRDSTSISIFYNISTLWMQKKVKIRYFNATMELHSCQFPRWCRGDLSPNLNNLEILLNKRT